MLVLAIAAPAAASRANPAAAVQPAANVTSTGCDPVVTWETWFGVEPGEYTPWQEYFTLTPPRGALPSSGEQPYPLLSVTINLTQDLPEGCSVNFSMNSYDAHAPNWNDSGQHTIVTHVTTTIDNEHRSATLTVTEPACFGQTDFYIGDTAFDGIDGAAPHGPNPPGSEVGTPINNLLYSNGGEECVDPTPTPSIVVDPTPSPSASPSGQVEGAVGTPNITLPPTDRLAAATPAGGSESWRIVLAGLAVMVLFVSLSLPRGARRKS
jgi:hypothetical protein